MSTAGFWPLVAIVSAVFGYLMGKWEGRMEAKADALKRKLDEMERGGTP